MKSFKLFGVALIAGLMLASCASVAHVEKDDTVNFSNYKTYTWVETKESTEESGKNRNSASLTERNIQQAIRNELEKQGWREVKTKPDVLLSYDISVERVTRQQNNAIYSQPYNRFFFNPYTRRWVTVYYPSQFLGYDNMPYDTREGTITVTMTDAKTDKVVWQGWTTDEVNSRYLTSKEIQSSIKSIFRKFDVASK